MGFLPIRKVEQWMIFPRCENNKLNKLGYIYLIRKDRTDEVVVVPKCIGRRKGDPATDLTGEKALLTKTGFGFVWCSTLVLFGARPFSSVPFRSVPFSSVQFSI
jgi:hypothetical protein